MPFFQKGSRVGDVLPFGCGAHVYDPADERFVGEVTFVSVSETVVLWPNGWRSRFKTSKLVVTSEDCRC